MLFRSFLLIRFSSSEKACSKSFHAYSVDQQDMLGEFKQLFSNRRGFSSRISGIGHHAGSNCQKSWLDFQVTSERYGSTSNLASRVELFGIGGHNGAA